MPKYKQVKSKVKCAITDRTNPETYRPIITEVKCDNGFVYYSTSCGNNYEQVKADMGAILLSDEEYEQAVILWNDYNQAKQKMQDIRSKINDFYRFKYHSQINYLMNKNKED